MDLVKTFCHEHERNDEEREDQHARTVHRERNVLGFVEISRNIPSFVAVIGTRGDQDVIVEMRKNEIAIRHATNKVDFSGGNVYELLRGKIKNDQHGEQKDLKEN